MRNELQVIQEKVAQTSRLGYLFAKGKMVTQVQNQLSLVEDRFVAIETELQTQTETLESVKRNLKRKEQAFQETEDELFDTQSVLKTTQKSLRESEASYAHLDETHQALSQSHQSLLAEFQIAQENTRLRDSLVGQLIATKNDNPMVKKFSEILHQEFLPFAAEESALENEAGALLQLQEIEKELTMISGFPDFHSAHTVAVAGGFSAGKSEFISSFFRNKTIKLPSSIEPTTAIPTYVVHSKQAKNGLIGINQQGGQ